MQIMDRIKKAGVVPVIVLDSAEQAVPTAKALLAGGIDVMEITFRTEAAAAAIREVAEHVPEMCVGAGSVRTAEQCRTAIGCGAAFIVSAGFSEPLVLSCREQGIPALPGCVTPTEIMAAMDCGLDTVKFFPAGAFGGLSAIRALSEPFPGLKFVPTGGVRQENLEDYLRTPCIAAVGGSWICRREDINEGRFDRITELTARASETVRRVRGE
jgi:2-dehydro-3-deoxyphosphogluconate aldolase/(4S)-4-hydroxy-2-oxoglutarate aldolase